MLCDFTTNTPGCVLSALLSLSLQMPHTCTKSCVHGAPRLMWMLFTHSGFSRLKQEHTYSKSYIYFKYQTQRLSLDKIIQDQSGAGETSTSINQCMKGVRNSLSLTLRKIVTKIYKYKLYADTIFASVCNQSNLIAICTNNKPKLDI